MNFPLPKSLRAFRYRNYRLFFTGQSVAITGTWITLAALGWLLYRLTSDPFTLGLMGFCLHAPTFVLAPFGGVLVDRANRRNLIIAAQLTDAAVVSVLAVLTLSGRVEVWHILTGCVLFALTKSFEMPARQALVVNIVDDRRDLSNAIALNSTIFHGARLVGPMLAGAILIPLGGEGLCFGVHALSYSVAVVCFLRLRVQTATPEKMRHGVLGELREGFGYAFGNRPIRALLLLVVGFVLLGQAFNTLLPVFAREVLAGDSGTFGLLLAASGLGAVTAALLLAARASVVGLGKIIFLSTLLFALSLALFGLSNHIALSLLMLFGCGFASINVMVGTNTIIQTLVDDRLRGRVMSLLGMVFKGALPLGMLLYGKAAATLGAPTAVMIGAAGCVLTGLAFRIQLPSLRRIARPVYVQRGILPATRDQADDLSRPEV
jgi:MFS family permease